MHMTLRRTLVSGYFIEQLLSTRNIDKRYIIIEPHETKMIPTDIASARDCGFMLYA